MTSGTDLSQAIISAINAVTTASVQKVVKVSKFGSKVPRSIQLLSVPHFAPDYDSLQCATYSTALHCTALYCTALYCELYASDILNARVRSISALYAAYLLSSPHQVTHTLWTEYQVAFASTTTSQFSTLRAVGAAGAAYVMTFLAYNNYPCYYDTANPRGYGGSGRSDILCFIQYTALS